MRQISQNWVQILAPLIFNSVTLSHLFNLWNISFIICKMGTIRSPTIFRWDNNLKSIQHSPCLKKILDRFIVIINIDWGILELPRWRQWYLFLIYPWYPFTVFHYLLPHIKHYVVHSACFTRSGRIDWTAQTTTDLIQWVLSEYQLWTSLL